MNFLLTFLILGYSTQSFWSLGFPNEDSVGGSGIHYVPESIGAAGEGGDCGLLNEVPNEPRTITPWGAAIFYKDGRHGKIKYLFSGTVIGPSTIITFGERCWRDVDNIWKLRIPNLLVGLGLKSTNFYERDNYSQIAEVMYVQPHPKYNEKTRIHVVAIINLKTPFNLTSPFARAACVPTFENVDQDGEFFTPVSIAVHGGFDYDTRRDGFQNFKVVNIKMQSSNDCLELSQFESKAPVSMYCGHIISGGFTQTNNLFAFYGSTPVIKIGSTGKHYIVGIKSAYSVTINKFNCDKDSVNWFSHLNGTVPWIMKVMNCGPNQWSCENGECIDIKRVCDHKSDCQGEYNDEDPFFCKYRNQCSSDEFECGPYDECVKSSRICDSKQDCPNGEDEDIEGVCAGKLPLPVSRGCNGIQETEGVRIECENPEMKSRVDCSNQQRQVAFGVRAKFMCEKYYTSSINRAMVTKQCGKNGQWSPAISFGCVPDCGRAEKALNILIVNGSLTSRDLWPWHVAIFKFDSDEKRYMYICGGSLIHRAGVLTAAHCFLSEANDKMESKTKFKVVFSPVSSSYEENLLDPRTLVLDILEINIPKSFSPRNFQEDLAIIQLSKLIVFNDYIRPVCFPTSSQEHRALANFQLSASTLGQVIGFGIDETLGISKNLRFANLPVVSTKDCFDELKEAPRDSTYCAGYTNGTSVCNGDSGGGMVFQSGTGISPRYFIQGIVSYGPTVSPHSALCNSHSYAIFTRVGFFSDWIDEALHKIEISL